MSRIQLPVPVPRRPVWNKGRIVGPKRPLKPKQVWAIRIRIEMSGELRDLALFNLAIDSKLLGCDLVRMRVREVMIGANIRERVTVVQSKTQRPVQFEVTENTRKSVLACKRAGSETVGADFKQMRFSLMRAKIAIDINKFTKSAHLPDVSALVSIRGRGPDFDSVVRRLEDVEMEYGGTLEESERNQQVTYYFPEKGRLEFDLADGRISICAERKSSFLDILELATPIALGAAQEPIKYLSDDSQRV